MSDAVPVPSVSGEEWLARFVTSTRWVRQSDQTVKQDAFIPYPYPDLSVTRHKDLSDQEIWGIGQTIAHARPRRSMVERISPRPKSGAESWKSKPDQSPRIAITQVLLAGHLISLLRRVSHRNWLPLRGTCQSEPNFGRLSGARCDHVRRSLCFKHPARATRTL